MKKNTVCYTINTIIACLTTILSIIFATPTIVFPIIAIGCMAIVITTILTLKIPQNGNHNKSVIKIIIIENNKNEQEALEKYEHLHSLPNLPRFRGDHKLN